MATIVGAITTSHVPAIGGAIAKGRQQEPYWKPFFSAFGKAREWLAAAKPDAVVVVYNDHGLQFFLDKMPTFAVGAAEEYRNADEGWGLPTLAPFRGDDVPGGAGGPRLHGAAAAPLARPARLVRVLIVGTGGLSHQLDGPRAGFINAEFDRMCMAKIVEEPEALGGYSIAELVELAGSQGAELLNWLVARAALDGRVSKVHSNYHVPISNTASGMMVLENA